MLDRDPPFDNQRNVTQEQETIIYQRSEYDNSNEKSQTRGTWENFTIYQR